MRRQAMTEYVKERQAQKEKSMRNETKKEMLLLTALQSLGSFATEYVEELQAKCGIDLEEDKPHESERDTTSEERRVKACTWQEFYDGIREKSAPEETEDDAAEEDDTDEEADALRTVKWHIDSAIRELKCCPIHPARVKDEGIEIHYIAQVHGYCMGCGSEVDSTQGYCPACGQALEWEGIDEE